MQGAAGQQTGQLNVGLIFATATQDSVSPLACPFGGPLETSPEPLCLPQLVFLDYILPHLIQ